MAHPAIAITAGEPAGIGPELVARLAARQRERPWPARLVVFGNHDLIISRARRIGIAPEFVPFDAAGPGPNGGLIEMWDEPIAAPVEPGRPDPANAASVVAMLTHATDAWTALTAGAGNVLLTASRLTVLRGRPTASHASAMRASTACHAFSYWTIIK